MSLSETWDTKKKEIIMAIGVCASVVTLFTGIVFVDDRYVHASDFSQQVQEQSRILKEYRVQNLQDKIFELEFKEQAEIATPLDKALKERYLQQLRQIK